LEQYKDMNSNIEIDEKTKNKMVNEVLNITLVNLKLLNIEPDKSHIDLATIMFQEGIKYWEEKRREYAKS